ncbi:MAG TPA: hypothetical protein VFV58_36720 [Blastocatellia bacterium]|nr:hypothetical protein [Blastocatellia bacterium]
MRTFFQDLRYGSQMLLKRLGFTLMALLDAAEHVAAGRRQRVFSSSRTWRSLT